MLLINTFDVEPWWATVPPCIDISRWGDMPDRSEGPLREYLDICDEAGVKATFFFVGWYAQKFPLRVKEVVRRGHEIGCHSMYHEDVATLSLEQFHVSTLQAKSIIEDIASSEVISYRAPSFSFPKLHFADFLAALYDIGFKIDSSIATADRIHGGGFNKELFDGPGSLKKICGVDIFEVPIPGVKLPGCELQIFGGGYFRLTPSALLHWLARKEPYQVLYLHPHDFDKNPLPLPNGGVASNMRRRLNSGDLKAKVLSLFEISEVCSCGQLLSRNHFND
jgi:peptidoglycan-N-acetylglucosamine deacetylase